MSTLLVTALLCAVAAPPPASAPAADLRPLTDFEQGLAAHTLDFADHLFADGDYYRAIGDYRRYLFLTRGAGDEAPRAALAIGEAYLRGRQLDAAHDQFLSVAQRSGPSPQRAVAYLSAGRAALLADKPLLAQSRLDEAIAASSDSAPLADEARFLLAWAKVALQQWDAARSLFLEVAGRGGARATECQAALKQLERRTTLDEKSPLLAGALSIIPGLGHMYLGQWAVGFAALFWNALFVFATGYSMYTQEWGVAAVLGVFELTWWSGTLFGALNGAFRYNHDAVENWIDDLQGSVGRARELGPVASAPGKPGELGRLVPTAALN